jgi:hypothetical protein
MDSASSLWTCARSRKSGSETNGRAARIDSSARSERPFTCASPIRNPGRNPGLDPGRDPVPSIENVRALLFTSGGRIGTPSRRASSTYTRGS